MTAVTTIFSKLKKSVSSRSSEKKDTVVDPDYLVSVKHLEKARRRRRAAKVYGSQMHENPTITSSLPVLAYAHGRKLEQDFSARIVLVVETDSSEGSCYEEAPSPTFGSSRRGRSNAFEENKFVDDQENDNLALKELPGLMIPDFVFPIPRLDQTNKSDSVKLDVLLDAFPSPPSFSSLSNLRAPPRLSLPSFESLV
ncbi:hypothetical protein V5O48_010359 [Marasmius crinis-equi]|uniref:Uncharacterized protein n=1 Tax=Marasmius crinis-equi TaxID=585013 RepID=A0ABR3F8K2_9AGAR